MREQYDLVVIGSGVAAQSAIYRVRAAGWRVVVIDDRPFGGTCQLRGCDPKKVLVAAESAVDAAHRMAANGVAGSLRIDWPALMQFKRGFTDPVPQRHLDSLAAEGIEAIHGTARFVAPDRIAVAGRDLAARHVLLATGAGPVPLDLPGEANLATSDDFLELDALPGRIALVGGGYIAAELSQLAARAGAEVTILQRGPRLLPKFDPDLVGWLLESFRGLRIDVRTGAAVTGIEKTARGFVVHAGEERVAADLVVHAAGRVPNLRALDLAAGQVQLDGHRLALNPFLQSVSNPRVYAAGDAAQRGPALTPIASQDGSAVARNLLEGNCQQPNNSGVPSVAFTVPPIAAVGMSEQQARESGCRVRVRCERTSDWFTARHQGEAVSGYKTLVDEDTGRILGAHLVGPHADEVINLFGLAVRHGLTAEALQDTIFGYPTAASDLSSML